MAMGSDDIAGSDINDFVHRPPQDGCFAELDAVHFGIIFQYNAIADLTNPRHTWSARLALAGRQAFLRLQQPLKRDFVLFANFALCHPSDGNAHSIHNWRNDRMADTVSRMQLDLSAGQNLINGQNL